jgi:hypothetical protein
MIVIGGWIVCAVVPPIFLVGIIVVDRAIFPSVDKKISLDTILFSLVSRMGKYNKFTAKIVITNQVIIASKLDFLFFTEYRR